MKERGRVTLREIQIAEGSFCTARPFADYGAVFRLRIDQGMRVLDVGAGASNFTATLLERGLEGAYALDPMYADIPGLKRKVRAHSQLMISLARTEKSQKEWEEFSRRSERTMQAFDKSARVKPLNYVTGHAGEMPFANNYFDYVLAFNSVSEYPALDSRVFQAVVVEMFRVTRPGGVIQMQPFGERTQVLFDHPVCANPALSGLMLAVRRANHNWLLDYLTNRGIKPEYLAAKSEHRTLLFTKPAGVSQT